MSIVLAPSVEDTVLSPLYGLGSFVKSSVGRIYVGLFPGSLFRSLDRFIARCLGALTAAAPAASQQVSELGSAPSSPPRCFLVFPLYMAVIIIPTSSSDDLPYAKGQTWPIKHTL